MRNQTPLTQQEFASRIGKTPRTVQRWDEKGVFPARRNPAGEPFYLEMDVIRYLEGRNSQDPPDLPGN